MVSKTQRKIIEIGNKKYRSTAVTLPPDWIRFHEPDMVDIFYDSILVLSLPNQSNDLEKKLRDFLQILSIKKERHDKRIRKE
jgi:hypothetical protein